MSTSYKQSKQSNQDNKYIQPRYRTLTKKTELKKEFSIKAIENEFPSLQNKNIGKNINIMSFANATKTEVLKEKEIEHEVIPGWVHIYYNKGKIEYKYGEPSNRYSFVDDSERINSRMMFNYRLAKDQYEIDNDVARLGDLSEYYGDRPLKEMYEEYEREIYYREE